MLGKIAGLMNNIKERRTPLQISLDNFSRKLAIIIMFICALIFGLCIYRQMNILDSMIFAVALAVAAIPEALSSIVTIVQAMGTQKMAKNNAIIKFCIFFSNVLHDPFFASKVWTPCINLLLTAYLVYII